MINFGPTYKHKVAISASRLDTFNHCSAKYGANYLYKLPDKGNDGSSRGSTCHEILEILAKEKWQKLVREVVKAGSCKSFSALWKLINIYARKYNVGDLDNLNTIDKFLIVGLIADTKPEGTIEVIIEKEFDFEVIDPNGKSFRLKGFIDKIYICKKFNSLSIICRDFKTSKAKFDKAKIENNIQAMCYQVALKYLYPEYKLEAFEFIFLKFPKAPVQISQLLSDSALSGFEYYLTEMQLSLENFTEKNLSDNYGADNPKYRPLCGKSEHGFKEDGSPVWVCPARLPMDYYVLLDSKGVIKKSGFQHNDLTAGEGEIIEKRRYGGCSFFYDPVTEKKRHLEYT